MDWVKERAKCTALWVHQRLLEQTKLDVETRNEQVKGRGSYAFSVQEEQGYFLVGIHRSGPMKFVKVQLDGERIRVSGDDGQLMIEGAVTLNDAGECRLQVGELELEEWQFRRRALEELLFRTEN